MSGGEFDYDQYKIDRIAEEVDTLIRNNSSTELDEWGYPKGHNYSPEVIAKFKQAVVVLRQAFVYAHRIDWLVSGDDGEDTFLRYLEQELQEITDGK